MALETGTYIDDLVATNPTATDDVSEGDDHLRLIKSTIKATFPNIDGAMNATQAQLNQIGTGQFAFPASQNASADANTLDDYEEGIFTPTLQDGSFSDSEGQTYLVQTGTYTKIGNRVFFDLILEVNSIGTLTTASAAYVSLGTLPNSGAGTAVTVGYGDSLNISAGQAVTGYMISGVNNIRLELWDSATGSSSLLISEFSAGGDVTISGHYRV